MNHFYNVVTHSLMTNHPPPIVTVWHHTSKGPGSVMHSTDLCEYVYK